MIWWRVGVMFMPYDSDFLYFPPFFLLLLYIFQFNSLSSLWQQYRAKRSQLGTLERRRGVGTWRDEVGWGGDISQFISLSSTSLSSSPKWNMKTVEEEPQQRVEEGHWQHAAGTRNHRRYIIGAQQQNNESKLLLKLLLDAHLGR